MMHKKARKQFAEDKQTNDMHYWNHVLWSDETKINLFCSEYVSGVEQEHRSYFLQSGDRLSEDSAPLAQYAWRRSLTQNALW